MYKIGNLYNFKHKIDNKNATIFALNQYFFIRPLPIA